MSQVKLSSNGNFIIETKRFNGGRNKCAEWSGFVRMEVSPVNEDGEVQISILDNLNSVDGHYSPLELDLTQLYMLKQWVDNQLQSSGATL